MMFSFVGMDAQIAIKRSDGVHIDGGIVVVPPEDQAEPQQLEGEQHGNEQPQAT